MKQAIVIAKAIGDVATGVVLSAVMLGAGFIIGAGTISYVVLEAKATGAKEERSKNACRYEKNDEEL